MRRDSREAVASIVFFGALLVACLAAWVISSRYEAEAWNRLHPDAPTKATTWDALFLELRAD